MLFKPLTDQMQERLARTRDFSRLSSPALNAIIQVAVYSELKTGEKIWCEGDPCDFCIYVLDGLLEIQRLSGTEGETVIGIFGPGDAIGISAILKKTTYPGTSVSLAKSTVVKLYLRRLISDPDYNGVKAEIEMWLRELLIKHEQILRDKIDILSAGNIDSRLFEFLKHLTRRFGRVIAPHSYEINIGLTKSKASKLIGVRSETAIRLINDWQKKNLIHWNEKEIRVYNLDAIENYVMMKGSK